MLLILIFPLILKYFRVHFESLVNDLRETVNVLLEFTFFCKQVVYDFAFNCFYSTFGFNLALVTLT